MALSASICSIFCSKNTLWLWHSAFKSESFLKKEFSSKDFLKFRICIALLCRIPFKSLLKRSCVESKSISHSFWSGNNCSIAAEGVGARKSATKSLNTTSGSCPIAETMGVSALKIASITKGSLNAHKSSKLPPPRAKTIQSKPKVSATAIFLAILSVAPSPCTSVFSTTNSTRFQRFCATRSISCSTAPVLEVSKAIFLGNFGNGFLFAK